MSLEANSTKWGCPPSDQDLQISLLEGGPYELWCLEIGCWERIVSLQPLTHGGPNPVAFGVDEPPDLGEVAVPLGDVLDGGGLHQQGVISRQGPLDSFLVVLNESCGFAAHESPHFFEGRNFGFLGK